MTVTVTEPSLSIRETSKRLRVTRNYIYELIYADKLKAWKDGGRWRVSLASVESRLEMRRMRHEIQSLYMEESDNAK